MGVLTWVWVYSYPSGFASTRKYQSILSTYWRTVPLIQYLISNYNKDVFTIRQNSIGMSHKSAHHQKTEGQVSVLGPRGHQGRAPSLGPNSVIFMQFLSHPHLELTPPGKSWIRHWLLICSIQWYIILLMALLSGRSRISQRRYNPKGRGGVPIYHSTKFSKYWM